MANWTYDPSQYEQKTYQVIPAGDYRARITNVTERDFSSGNTGYEIELEINGYNSKVWFYLVLDASNPQNTNQRIGDFFDSFSITNYAMGTGKQWVGMAGAVRIKHEEYKGETKARVAYCIARSRQDKLPAWKNTGTGTGAAAAAPVDIPSDLPFNLEGIG